MCVCVLTVNRGVQKAAMPMIWCSQSAATAASTNALERQREMGERERQIEMVEREREMVERERDG
jgi:hypothetical protein